MQVSLADPEFVHMCHGLCEIVDVRPALSVALHHESGGFRNGQSPGELTMRPVRDKGNCRNRLALGAHRHDAWYIDSIDHFALPKRFKRTPHLFLGNPKRDAPARPALTQAQHQTRHFGSSAVTMGINAQGSMVAVQQNRASLGMRDFRGPHEGTVAVYPEITARHDGHESAKIRFQHYFPSVARSTEL